MTYTRPAESRAVLRLHLNENTAGCSPAVLEAIRAVDRREAACYPDYSEITRRCEQWFDVPPGSVQLTNGLDEGLLLVALQARLQTTTPADSGTIVIVEPAFEMYTAYAQAVGAGATHIPAQPDFRFPLDEILTAITDRTRLIYLTDPNNPSGAPIPSGAIERIADAAAPAIVLVDEAYADFSGRTCIGPMLDRYRNLIVGRTFAKAYGLAGFRIGALIGSPATIDPIRRLQPPYSVNICAVRALEAALDDRPYVEWYVAQAAESKRRVYERCDRLGLGYWRSEGNFVLVQIGDGATATAAALAARGIEIRDRSRQPGCTGCVRMTAGVVAATDQCLDALEDELASRAR